MGNLMGSWTTLASSPALGRAESLYCIVTLGADDGIRTRDPHLGKVMPTSAGDRSNRWSRDQRRAFTAGDRWNRWSPLHWSSKGVAARGVLTTSRSPRRAHDRAERVCRHGKH